MSGVDLLLDVDGVLNAFGYNHNETTDALVWPEYPKTYRHVFTPDAGGTAIGAYAPAFHITYFPSLMERLNALTALPQVTPYWLTTWLDEAPTRLAARIGLDGQEWPVLGGEAYNAPRKMSDYSWWKLPAAREQFENSENRMVWVDDDLWDAAAREWAEAQDPSHLLLIQPMADLGITPKQMLQIEEFVGV